MMYAAFPKVEYAEASGLRRYYFSVTLAYWLAFTSLAVAQDGWSVRTLCVQQETQLDWVYPLLRRSPEKAPAELAAGYRSAAQEYELHGPEEDGAGGNWPMVIFISPSDRPVGWRLCEPTCRRHGVLLADLVGMGNGKPAAHRVRAVLDVLDDVRGRYDVDPNRTYLVGFSGGAHVACTVGLHLPEYAGGVIAAGYAPLPIDDEAVVAGVKRRLSLAMVVGEREPAAAQAEDYAAPWWMGVGVRTQLTVLQRQGHTLPKPGIFEQAFEWLEEGVVNRQRSSQRGPVLKVDRPPSRLEWADARLAAAGGELEGSSDAETVDAALVNLEGIVQRWPDLPAAQAAQSNINEYAARPQKPWEAVRKARRLQVTALHADGLERLAHRGGRMTAHERLAYAKNAVSRLSQLRDVERDAKAMSAMAARIAALEKLIADAPPDAAAVPLNRVRFNMNGDVTLAEGIAYVRSTLARLGYELEVDEAALRDAGVDLEKPYKPRLKSVELNELDRRFFRRAGVKLQRTRKTFRVIPVESSTPPPTESANVSRD
jgi:predicted esterase